MNIVPTHVSIIMDGNGRWAKNQGKERIFGHVEGVESVRVITATAVEKGIKYLSLYTFSEENWNRPDSEVNFLLELMMKSIAAEIGVMMKNNVKFVVLGNRARLSDKLNAAIDGCMKQTENNTATTMILFLSYSGKWDILNAAKQLALEAAAHPEKAEQIAAMTMEQFNDYFVTAGVPDPDLIIRTSGEKRISNYLLWQGAYSEFYFTDTLWPDFKREQFLKALDEYAQRDRRYGKVK